MEGSQVDVSDEIEDGAVSVGPDDPLIKEPATVVSCSEVMVASSSFEKKEQSNLGAALHLQSSSGANCDLAHQLPTSSPGVSNCYVFKSRLQEYAQRVGLPTPVYETIKEGPSHEPSFRSTVIVNGARYDSLLGFFNRKAAEQSAAEVALMELSKSGDQTDSIAMPVHETGLCKNLLQEYAQKMNYAIPTYICQKEDTHGRTPLFSCAVDIGGTKYIGAAVKTKKEAEIKAARTALLAIWSSGTAGDHISDKNPQYTVVPGKRKVAETAPPQVKIAKVKKPKRSHFKKKAVKQTKPCNEAGMMDVLTSNEAGMMGVLASNNGETLLVMGASGPQVGGVEPMESQVDASSCQLDGETSHVKGASGSEVGGIESMQTQLNASSCQVDGETCHVKGTSGSEVGGVESMETQLNASSNQRDVSGNHDVGNLIPLTNAPPSVPSDVVLPDSAAVSESNHTCEENNGQGSSKNTPMIDDPLCGQSPTDSGVNQVEAANAVVDSNYVVGENIVWVGKVLEREN